MNVRVIEILMRVVNGRVRLVPKFRNLWNVQYILSAVAAGLTNTVIFHIVVIYVIGSGIGQRIYLLEWKPLIRVILVTVRLLLLVLHHAFAHAIFFVVFEWKVQVLDLVLLIELHIVCY